ncbi:MAG: adenylate/guanylate cyclase domain-containing protein [Prosthecobacter sp.]|nr:adenylate/guanylate cyclase domain-containing protein [Prosthecobacter sp.]
MGRNRSAAMLIGVLVCIPLLVLYRAGWFPSAAIWLRDMVLPRFVVLPPEGLRLNLPLQYAYYTAAAFSSAWVCIELFTLWRKIAYLLGMVFLTCSFTVVMAWMGTAFEPYSGILAALTAGTAGLLISSGTRGYRRHMLRRFFVGRLWARSFDDLAAQNRIEKLTERREITVLTCRMANHLELSEESEARAFEAFTAHFEHEISDFLVARGGYLDTCTAQRIRVLFGYPLADEHHALHAAQVLLQLRDYWPTLQREMQTRWLWKPRFGAALSTGTAACGLFGHREFQSFSAVGEAVDLSDRLCGLNAIYGTQILLSARTYALVKDNVEVRPMEMVVTPRLKQVSEVYELLGVRGDLDESEIRARDAFWQGILQLRKGDRALAQESFEQAKIDGRDDAPLRYFLERVSETKKDKPADAITAPPKHARPLNAV